MKFPKVSNMTSPLGNTIANQFIIETDKGRYFQSYNSIIVAIINNETFLDEWYWDYSNTTRKYRNIFLRQSSKEIKNKIKEGVYKLVNLN